MRIHNETEMFEMRQTMQQMAETIQNREHNVKSLNDKAAWIRRGILQALCPVQSRFTRIRNVIAHRGDILVDLNLCWENPLLADGFYRGYGMTIFRAKKLVETNAIQGIRVLDIAFNI
jgi:hypothetical protein